MISRSLLRQLPARVTTGAYVLNSGLGKLHADQQTAESLQGWAATTHPAPRSHPIVRSMEPDENWRWCYAHQAFV